MCHLGSSAHATSNFKSTFSFMVLYLTTATDRVMTCILKNSSLNTQLPYGKSTILWANYTSFFPVNGQRNTPLQNILNKMDLKKWWGYMI